MTLAVVVGLIQLGRYCYDFGYRVFTEEPVSDAPGKEVVVSVTSDMSEMEIGNMLEEEGLVRDGLLFFAQLKLSAYSGKLQPGIYTLNTSMSGKDMIVVMAAVPEEQEDTESGDTEEESGQTEESGTEETDEGEQP